MEQPPNIEMVYLAVSTLYNNPNTAAKEKASAWLGDLQKSVFAWKIADQMLQEKRDVESCYFAAQTMRTKIQFSFHELPADAHLSLRDSLLNHIGEVTDGTNTIIVVQLCLAVADCALQMPTWQSPVLDLIGRFSQAHLWPLLEIMTVLPEEVESRTVRLGANRRVEVLEHLKACAATVLEFLKVCLNGSDGADTTHIVIKVVRCFTSWVAVQAVTLADVSENVVVGRAFLVLSDHKAASAVHDAATDCVCALLQCLEDNNNQPALELQLYQGVVCLEQAYHLSVANEDQEKSMNYCRIFTELGESFLDKIIVHSTHETQHFAIKILDLVLVCVGHHDYEVAEISFNLWYRLSEEVYQKNSQGLTQLFRPYVERLVTALCRHAQMEPDLEGLLEDGDDFRDFRLKVCDLIKDVVFIVGSSNCFRQMFLNLQAPEVTWDASEAALFVMQAVAKNILPEENDVVPKVVEAILGLPENTHIAVRFTSVLLLGELCEWVERHPQSLEPILSFLLCALQQAGVAAAAAAALQSVCGACHDHMPGHVPVLLQLLHRVDTFAITNTAVIGLLRGVAAIVGCMPPAGMAHALRDMCLLQVTPLCALIERDVVPVRGTPSDPALWLDRLAAVFRYVHVRPLGAGEEHPCRAAVAHVWPVLASTFTKYQTDMRVMERCCRCVRFTLRCLGPHARHLLEPLATQTVLLYGRYQHSCFLYLGSILVDEYATDAGCVPGLLDMLQAFIEPTFTVLKEEHGLRNHPDTVDDFFRLCARFLQRAPLPFLRCPALPPIIQCALLSATLDHKEANMSVMKFFYDLVQCGRGPEATAPASTTSPTDAALEARRQLVLGVVREFGAQMVSSLLHACVFYLHTYMLSDVADVFVGLLEADRAAVAGWLEAAVQSLQNNSGAVHATHQQLVDFHVSVMRSDSSKSVTHALKDLLRLYR